MRKLNILLLCILLNPLYLYAESYTIATVPNPKLENSYMVDKANVVHQDDVLVLNNLLKEIEDTTQVQIALVILPSIGDQIPKDFAVNLFQKWGIGNKDTDEGLLILFVMDQRRFEFEVGYGLEGTLPDILVRRIAEEFLVPKLKSKETTVGIYNTLLEIQRILNEDKSLSEEEKEIRNQERILEAEEFISDNEPLVAEGYEWLYWLLGILYVIISIFLIFMFIGHYVEKMEADADFATRKESLKKEKWNPYFWLLMIPFLLPMLIVAFFLFFMRKELEEDLKDCEVCKKHTFEKLSKYKSLSYKKVGEVKEEFMGNAKTNVWLCSSCGHEKKEKIMLKLYKINSCSNCFFYTMQSKYVSTKVSATTTSTGIEVWADTCQYCGDKTTYEKVIPKRPVQTTSSSSSSSSSYSYSSSSSSSSYSSSSSSSSSWGGGSSGGGGYGGSW
jgi:uncharacterized protein